MSALGEKLNNFIRSGAFTGPKEGYKFQDGYKGVGYYLDEPAPPAPSTDNLASAWAVKCVDGTLELSQDEAAYLQTANLPTGMLPSATVRQVLDAAATVIAAASANGDYDNSSKKENEEPVKKKKLKKKKKPAKPVVFPIMGERVRDKAGTSTGTVRYIGTVHTSKNEHLNWVGVEWDDITRGKHDGWLPGPGGGERYFSCPLGAGSFVKAQKLQLSKDFVDVMKGKYEHGGEEEEIINSVDTLRGKSKPIILVGMDKVADWHQLNTIKKVSLENTFAGKINQETLAKACPQVRELNLSKTLIGTWNDVAKLGQGLPRLRSLRLDYCRLGPRLEYPLPMTHALNGSLSKLKVLVLSNTAIHFGQVLALEQALPNLNELHLCGNNISTFDPPRTTYGAWASTTGDRRFDRRGRVGTAHIDIFPNLEVLNLSKNNIDDWRQIWRFAWLPKLKYLMLNENKIDSVEFLGNWNDVEDSVKQSAIPEYAITYDSEILKTVPPPQDAAVVPEGGIGSDAATNAVVEDHSTVDGASKTKNQDMAKWARQTGTTVSSLSMLGGEAKSTGTDGANSEPANTLAFFNLRSLSLSHNNITEWKSIDELNKLPNLETLRVQHTPLNSNNGSTSILRQTFIARVGSLLSLNGGEVRLQERSDAEKLYIQRLLKAKLKEQAADTKEERNLASFVNELMSEHPRVDELLNVHGEPAVKRKGGTGTFFFPNATIAAVIWICCGCRLLYLFHDFLADWLTRYAFSSFSFSFSFSFYFTINSTQCRYILWQWFRCIAYYINIK